MNKAVFFDRDGVINYRMVKDYIKSIEEFHFLPDFLSFFEQIRERDCKLFVITNQQGVSKGIMTLEDLNKVLDYMQHNLFQRFGRNFDEIYYCTDLAESGSYYRKPNPGMVLEAIKKWNIDIENSWLIGDSPTDSIAGKKAGLKTILIGNYDTIKIPEADYIVDNLFDLEKRVPIFKDSNA